MSQHWSKIEFCKYHHSIHRQKILQRWNKNAPEPSVCELLLLFVVLLCFICSVSLCLFDCKAEHQPCPIFSSAPKRNTQAYLITFDTDAFHSARPVPRPYLSCVYVFSDCCFGSEIPCCFYLREIGERHRLLSFTIRFCFKIYLNGEIKAP